LHHLVGVEAEFAKNRHDGEEPGLDHTPVSIFRTVEVETLAAKARASCDRSAAWGPNGSP
jgi:hypothetical protein